MRLVLVIHNVRSAMNVGSILRTCEGFGIREVFMTGYTPYPEAPGDERLPHHRRRTARQIHKTALGAEYFLKWQYITDISECLRRLESDGYLITALEQTGDAVDLNEFEPKQDVALIVGNELKGLEPLVLKQAGQTVQIQMSGRKESFNVAVAAAIAIYHLSRLAKARQK